jgi:hypothetical protein
MDQENLNYLHDNLKYMGFGVDTPLNLALDAQVRLEPASFELFAEAFFDEESKMEARLFFKRGPDSERYYFNKYEALLRFTDNPEKDKAQTFELNKGGRGVTFKEAYNLLQGRYVHKMVVDDAGKKEPKWLQLNFAEKSVWGNYKINKFSDHFDLEKTLRQYKIRELLDEDLEQRICRSLRRGNLHPVTFILHSKKTQRMLIWASPVERTIKNQPEATSARGKGGDPIELTEIPEAIQDSTPEIEKSLLQDEPSSNKKKKVHL